MKARYNRVSSTKQNLDRQTSRASKDEVLFDDVISGSTPFNEREQGKRLIEAIKQGEINYVSVSSIDRLGRNTLDILQTIKLFTSYEVILKVDNLGLESLIKDNTKEDDKLKPNQTFNLIVSVMSNVAEMERETLLERQREGIAIAKAKGVYKGRVKGSTEEIKTFLFRYKNVIKEINKGTSLRRTAKFCDVSLGTVQKVKRLM
ncbi:recombinase family protein [Wenyingzhuangia sp. IMCC45574]